MRQMFIHQGSDGSEENGDRKQYSYLRGSRDNREKALEHRVQHLQQQNEELKSALANKEEEVQNLRDNIDLFRKREDSHEVEIRTLQKAAFRHMAEANSVPEDDTALRDEIRNCNERIWSWAKENAIQSLDKFKNSPTEIPEFLEYFSKTVRLIDGKFSAALDNQKMAGRLLLAAAVSHEIYSRTVNQRFLAFYTPIGESKHNNDRDTNRNEMEVLENTYDLLQQRNISTANLWRAQLYRILFPKPSVAMQEREESVDKQIEDSLKRTSGTIADKIESKPLWILFRETSNHGDARKKALEDIIIRVVHLAARLKRQRTDFGSEKPKNLLGQQFAAEKGNMEAHRFHQLNYEDTRVDGWEVGIVVHPAIIAWGDNDGEGYDSSRILSKAVVWLEDPQSHSE